MPTLTRFIRNTVSPLVIALAIAGSAHAGGDWNDAGIAWKPYEAGLAEAKAQDKPVCLIFYTQWCPHCTNYAKLFHDPALVELSKKFVMIHIDKDADTATSEKYKPDGDYIPRTYFLTAQGVLLEDITEQRPNYRYFYDESDPASLLRSMNAVLALPAEAPAAGEAKAEPDAAAEPEAKPAEEAAPEAAPAAEPAPEATKS